jgi:hypothetical protein
MPVPEPIPDLLKAVNEASGKAFALCNLRRAFFRLSDLRKADLREAAPDRRRAGR